MVADIRDFTAAWQLGSTQGWSFSTGASLAMAGVTFIPSVGDAARSAVKPFLGKGSAKALSNPAQSSLQGARLNRYLYQVKKIRFSRR
jgi:hypothetical protein